MKVSDSFVIQEFVPPEIYSSFNNNSIWFIQKHIIQLAQFIRNYFDKSMTINNWHSGGQYKERGFRMPTTTTGGKLSQHKFGNAIDFTISGLTPDEVRNEILKNQSTFLSQGLTTLEDAAFAPTWVHADCRFNNNATTILIVKP